MNRQRRYGRTLPEALGEYSRRNPARFHMPGHKGQDIPYGGQLSGWDVTELDGTDDLSNPGGIIAVCEGAYRDAYGARSSMLLVGGSTSGLLTMSLALGRGRRVLLGRDSHKSALSALALAEHQARFLLPEVNPAEGLAGMLTPRQVEEALQEQPADAVLLTSPNYYGLCADVEGIADVAHAYGALLLVDAAHGAHFPFSPELPEFPAKKVDLWCVSVHKTMAAFTQSAVLHIGKHCPMDPERVRRVRNMVQTTSPSYLLMSSLDRALYVATKMGYQRHMDRVAALRERIGRINGLRVLDRDSLGYGAVDLDETRVVIDVTERGIDGPEAYESLASNGVVCEMCDAYRVVLITTPQDPDEWYDRLIDGLTHLPYGVSQVHKEPPYIAMGRQVCPMGEAMLGPTERIPLAGAVGRVAAVAAGVYPPGLPCLAPGEEIQGDAAAYLLQQQAKGFALFGVEEGRISCIKEDSGI